MYNPFTALQDMVKARMSPSPPSTPGTSPDAKSSDDEQPSLRLDRLHLVDVDDTIDVLPSTPVSPKPQFAKRRNSIFVDVAEPREHEDPKADLEDNYSVYNADGRGLESRAQISRDGTIDLQLKFKRDLKNLRLHPHSSSEDSTLGSTHGPMEQAPLCPSMNIVIMLVGSRGDIQPYVALGKVLQQDGHRVRIATHATFEEFVHNQGLEFFNIGGNPQDLMSYMVKNPGLIPGFASLTNGDIKRKRKMLKEMIQGCWRSCIEPTAATQKPFVADAIIANPPSFAHVHCAEALGIPLQMTFTMPWTPTTAFPHPLVNITQTNASFMLSNYLSYAVADLLTWQGIGDIINDLRTRNLGIPPLTLRTGPDILDRVKVPWTYCMSPALVPKPDDWKGFVDVVGFYFLDLATQYTPPPELAAFLSEGPPPIYVGFGSVVVDDPDALTNIIFEATAQANVRAVVSAGWGGLGNVTVPPHIFMLGSIPHDWLFAEERVVAVVHHGGAGTTAIGLAKGRPTVIVPFFGDQAFWGEMVYKSGAGPKPIPSSDLSVKKLRDAILFALSRSAKESAAALAEKILSEDGMRKGAESFYKHLPVENMRCDLDPSRMAVWWSSQYCLKLSAFAAQVLVDARMICIDTLELYQTKSYSKKKLPVSSTDSTSGNAGSKFWSITNGYSASGITENFTSPLRKAVETTATIPTAVIRSLSNVQDFLPTIPESLKRVKSVGSSRAKPAPPTHNRTTSAPLTLGMLAKPRPVHTRGINGSPSPGRKLRKTKPLPPAITPLNTNFSMSPSNPSSRANTASDSLNNVTNPPPLTASISNPQDAWKATQNDSCRQAIEAIRCHRIAQGLEAVSWIHSTDEQRKAVVDKFRMEVKFTPVRKETLRHREEVERMLEREMEAARAAEGESQRGRKGARGEGSYGSGHGPVELKQEPEELKQIEQAHFTDQGHTVPHMPPTPLYVEEPEEYKWQDEALEVFKRQMHDVNRQSIDEFRRREGGVN